MIQRAIFPATIMLFLAAVVSAQDPTKVAPQAYKLEFENEWVKVMRVHYAPHEKIPEHDHTEDGAAYVYLNDSGPVIFKHIGLSYGAVKRPETKAGSFRLYKAVKETHEVENPSDTPSDFMRVEFKTAPDNAQALRGKFYREPVPMGETLRKVQFENEQIQVTRMICVKGKTCDVSAGATTPALIVGLTPGEFKPAGGGKQFALQPGGVKWFNAGQKGALDLVGEQPAELLRFELKSKPVAPVKKPTTHAHPHD